METTEYQTPDFDGATSSMSRQGVIILAAIIGAGVAALLASYFTTETGKQLLSNAANQLKEVGGKAVEVAKTTAGEVITEAKSNLGNVVKDKLAQTMNKV